MRGTDFPDDCCRRGCDACTYLRLARDRLRGVDRAVPHRDRGAVPSAAARVGQAGNAREILEGASSGGEESACTLPGVQPCAMPQRFPLAGGAPRIRGSNAAHLRNGAPAYTVSLACTADRCDPRSVRVSGRLALPAPLAPRQTLCSAMLTRSVLRSWVCQARAVWNHTAQLMRAPVAGRTASAPTQRHHAWRGSAPATTIR